MSVCSLPVGNCITAMERAEDIKIFVYLNKYIHNGCSYLPKETSIFPIPQFFSAD